jgi:hypothetical protein
MNCHVEANTVGHFFELGVEQLEQMTLYDHDSSRVPLQLLDSVKNIKINTCNVAYREETTYLIRGLGITWRRYHANST